MIIFAIGKEVSGRWCTCFLETNPNARIGDVCQAGDGLGPPWHLLILSVSNCVSIYQSKIVAMSEQEALDRLV